MREAEKLMDALVDLVDDVSKKNNDLSFSEFEKLYSKQKLDDEILYAKDLKDRYTVLWLYYAYFR